MQTEIEFATENFSRCWAKNRKGKKPFGFGRFSTGDWPVLYTATSLETALAECVFHLYNQFSPVYSDGEEIEIPMVGYEVGFSGKIIDLVQEGHDPVALTDPVYDNCHKIADDVRANYCGCLTTSARQNAGICIPVFRKASIEKIVTASSIRISIPKGSRRISVLRGGKTSLVEIHDVHEELKKA